MLEDGGHAEGNSNHINGIQNHLGHNRHQENGLPNGSTEHTTQSSDQTLVAICGMGMRLPGGIRNDKDLYNFLINKGDARSMIGKDRYNIDAYYDEFGKPGTISTRHGYFINDVDFSHFDLSMFTPTPAEAEQVDPNHRLVLEVVREAFETAGEVDWRGKNIGTYVGMFSEDWQELQHKDTQAYVPYRVLGGLDFALPNRIAYEYDLQGPSMIIKSACSSAGLGLHSALQAIRQGEITSAMVCGSNLILAPGMMISMSLQGALSPEGSSKTFDASADGYARGEGVTALYIKRLDEAIRDKNPIRAVIRSSASNADGKTNGISLPNPNAHKAVIRKAYDLANLDLSKTAMVEAHGTGTKIGDPIEANAIADCFGENGVYLGAIKPNLGHSEGAAAITSIIKAVLSLEARTIIPNIKFETPNPAILWKRLKVPTETQDWPENRAERVSVSSYGIGGSNAHFILDSAASFGLETPNSKPSSRHGKQKKNLLLFSANHPESLKRIAENIEGYFRKSADCLDDLAYTLSERREHLKLRRYCVVIDGTTPFQISPETKSQGPRRVAFVFTGQGAQWVHMGKHLILDYPSVLSNIKSFDRILQGLDHAPSWSIEDTLLSSTDKSLINKAEYSQTICTALQIALVDFLAECRVLPSAVIGHSSGEIAAAYAAGVFTKDEAIITAYYRGYVCKKPPKLGGMVAVGMSKEEVSSYLTQGVQIACENSISNVTLSGDVGGLDSTTAKIIEQRPKVFVRRLQVEMAYHSYHMRSLGDHYRKLITKRLSPRSPRVPFYSSVKLELLCEASDFGPQYWQDNLENPVLFHAAVKKLLAGSEDCSLHLEVGPHSALSGPLRQVYSETSASVKYVPTLVRGKDDTESLLEALGQLYSLGVRISLPSGSDQARVLTDVPTYPWHYEKSFWSETRIMKDWRFRQHAPHDLLGLRILEGSDASPTWRNCLRLADVSWLKDHCVGNDVVFPGAAYVAMAGEAVFQLSNVRKYTVRDVEFSQAMVIYSDKPIEIMTHLRPQRLTSLLDSEFYEFEIVSSDGATWAKHCFGRVCSGQASFKPPKRTLPLERQVSSPRWYKTMSNVGLNYGPRFNGMKDISASILEKVAGCLVQDTRDLGESFYMIHPSTLDLVFQSLTVAVCQGIYRTFKTLFLPTFIEELYIGDLTGKTFEINTAANGKPGSFQGHSYGILRNEMVLYLRGFKGKPMENTQIEKRSDLKSLHLQWKPHFEFLEAKELMKVKFDIRLQVEYLERLYILCAVESQGTLVHLSTPYPHLEKYRSWLNQECERFHEPDFPVVDDSIDLVRLDHSQRRLLIQELLEACERSGARGPAIAIWRAFDQMANVFEGTVNYLELLLQGGILTALYNWSNDLWDLKDFLQLLGHTQPQMRILEIGAGTGGLTEKIVEQLKSDFGERLYCKYTFTDISSGFFVSANERFKDYQGMEYKILDISKDPLEQGFSAGEYDLIIASNVLHATPFLQDTLTNVRTLLRPKGQLFLQELCSTTGAMSFIMGLFSGWWLGENDGRTDRPFISPNEWDKRLRDAGFAGCDSVVLDIEQPYTENAIVIAKPAFSPLLLKNITLLRNPESHPLVQDIENLLIAQGVEIHHCEWGQEPPTDRDLISFVDLGRKPLLQNVNEQDLTRLLRMVDSLQQKNVLWLTSPAQIGPTDPYAAQLVGLSRSIRSELAMCFATLELENTGEGAARATFDTLKKIRQSKNDCLEIDFDMEYAWANGVLNVSRFHWVSTDSALLETAKAPETKGLDIGTLGLLQTLRFTSQPLGKPGPSEANVKMATVGLNFKDVMIAMGVIDGGDTLSKNTSGFGLEGVGYVTCIGSEVTNIAVGDRVITMGSESVGIATEIQRAASLCIPIPDQLSNEEGATMPVVYITVLLFLVEKCKLEKGQSILIHSAAGGVGIAAINVARWIGAEVYATVGTEEKVAFLVREFNIPGCRIFNSRDASFLDGILDTTDGKGVDLVLNSLSGELLHASWKCVAPHGTMAEIGKRDMVGRGSLALNLFEDNRTFIGGEISRLLVSKKSTVARLLELMLEQYLQGNFKPINPITVFKAEDIEDAFRLMQKGSHIGKVVIQFPTDDSLLDTERVIPLPEFRHDVTYLLVGGLGGLGKAVASWMVFHGARNLIFLSRSAGKSDEDRAFLKELNVMGSATQCCPCDVADYDAVKDAIGQATLPIAGLIQMSMVLRDQGVLGMDIDSWTSAVRPKVDGTWNLHHLLPEGLDFFVLFSSVSGTFGNYGQSNYASANTFLDSFAQYRQSLGQAASVIDIGPVDDIGYVNYSPATRESLLTTFESLSTEQDLLDLLQLAISRSSPQSAPQTKGSPLSGYQSPCHIIQAFESRAASTNSQDGIWKRDARTAIWENIQQTSTLDGSGAADHLTQFLSNFKDDPIKMDQKSSADLIAQELAICVWSFLGKEENDIDLSLTLAAVGVDSLVAIEVRNWWKQTLGVNISILELMNGGSIEQLGELALKRLKEKYMGKEVVHGSVALE